MGWWESISAAAKKAKDKVVEVKDVVIIKGGKK